MAFEQAAIVDSSVWIAYFNRDDSHTQRAEQIIANWLSLGTRLILTSFVVQEVSTVLLYEKKHETLKTFIAFVEQNDATSLFIDDMPLIHKTVDFAERHEWHPKISLTDWALLYLSISSGIGLSTFDRQLSNALIRFTKELL